MHKPTRVLHCFDSLGKGGIETWLMNILRSGAAAGIKFDFMLIRPGGFYEAEALQLGCKIYYAPPIRRLEKHLTCLKETLINGDYGAVHFHGEEFLGDLLKAAFHADVPLRIAHCHSTRLARGRAGFEMKMRSIRHRTIDRFRILKYATTIAACSSDSGKFLLGRRWLTDTRAVVIYCGVPVRAYDSGQEDRAAIRAKYRVPPDAIVVGHAGSMGPSPAKNHFFILQIFAELAKTDPRYHLFLAGDGPQRSQLRDWAASNGLSARVLMPGLCENVPELMAACFDVHLLPSLFEGLPLVGLEAVSSGLFTVCSDAITDDFAAQFPGRVEKISLNRTPEYWAARVAEGVLKKISPSMGAQLVRDSPFNLEESVCSIAKLYFGTSTATERMREQ